MLLVWINKIMVKLNNHHLCEFNKYRNAKTINTINLNIKHTFDNIEFPRHLYACMSIVHTVDGESHTLRQCP